MRLLLYHDWDYMLISQIIVALHMCTSSPYLYLCSWSLSLVVQFTDRHGLVSYMYISYVTSDEHWRSLVTGIMHVYTWLSTNHMMTCCFIHIHACKVIYYFNWGLVSNTQARPNNTLVPPQRVQFKQMASISMRLKKSQLVELCTCTCVYTGPQGSGVIS